MGKEAADAGRLSQYIQQEIKKYMKLNGQEEIKPQLDNEPEEEQLIQSQTTTQTEFNPHPQVIT